MTAARLRVAVPADYVLRRDLCSYGYFLLAPNRWDPQAEVFSTTLELPDGPATVRVRQGSRRGSPLDARADRPLAAGARPALRAALVRMLRLDDEVAAIADFHARDPRWAASGRGRLMRSPTFFEDVIKTVTSCNVAWPSTIRMNARLCEVFGRASPSGRHAFPTARRLARARAPTLRARCRVGYRDARIIELARMFAAAPARGGVDEAWFHAPGTSDEAVYAALLRWPGVGPYAAANIMQLLGRYARLPLDTESLRHGKTVLGYTGTDGAILRALHAHYAPMGPHAFRSYWFELWAFYESRRGPAWTWDQETTAATFTAAKWRAEERAAAGRSPRALPHRGLQPDATAEVRMMRSHSPPGHLHRGGGGTASMDRR